MVRVTCSFLHLRTRAGCWRITGSRMLDAILLLGSVDWKCCEYDVIFASSGCEEEVQGYPERNVKK